jgi:hypothetical protein
MRVGAILALCCLGLVVAGCGESKLDTSRLESQIEKALHDRTGVSIASVRCPDDVKAEKGDTFRCVAQTTGHEQVVIDVRQDDDKGAVTWRVARPSGKS